MKSIKRLLSLSKRFFEVLKDEGIGAAYIKTRTKLTNRLRMEQNREVVYQTDETHFGDIYKTYLSTGQNKTAEEYVPLPSYDLSNENLPVKAIAFYLPQYHPIPENDAWWGEGFTEWTNVSKATPNFVGHYQPHLPAELGFYDLRVPKVQARQAELAKKFGIYGFCFYYYWFNGKRLLELPLDQFVQNPNIDLPFCLCWANENWTRTWDGLDKEVLIAQSHSPESDFTFIKDILPYLSHERYIRIGGRPVLIVYRPQLLPDPIETVIRWRAYCKEAGLGDIYLVAVQSGRILDPRSMGFDAATEFPPHGIPFLPQLNSQLKITNPDFTGMVFDYHHVADQMRAKAPPGYKLFKAVVTCWDNTPRRQDRAMIFHNSSPQVYQTWLSSAIDYMRDNAP
jgi:lipopolysaccharide biosynthesis protein